MTSILDKRMKWSEEASSWGGGNDQPTSVACEFGGRCVMLTKLTRIIQAESMVCREIATNPVKSKRRSATFYRNRSRKAWETRKRQARARAASVEDTATDIERNAA